MARRIGGAGGGSDKGGNGGVVIAAVGVAVLLGTGGVVGTGVGGGVSAGGSGAGSSSATRTTARDVDSIATRLAARGVRVTGRFTDADAECTENAYGTVREYLRETPCEALYRSSIEIRDARGNVALVAVSTVEMADEASARELKDLMDTPGTGNITELTRDRGRYRSVRFTGNAYASRRDDEFVTNAQVEPVARGWSGLALTTVVNQAAGQ